jgi:UDP-N-acetylglucosamine acyltransferase
MIGAVSIVTNDVLPYTTVTGDRAKTVGVNEEGLRRSGWSKERIEGVKAATAMLLSNDQASLLKMTTAGLAAGDIKKMIKWAKQSRRGICAPKLRIVPANKL